MNDSEICVETQKISNGQSNLEIKNNAGGITILDYTPGKQTKSKTEQMR